MSAPFLSRQPPSLASKTLRISNFVHSSLPILSLDKAKSFPIVYRNLSSFTKNPGPLHSSVKLAFKHFNFFNFYLSIQYIFFSVQWYDHSSPGQSHLCLCSWHWVDYGLTWNSYGLSLPICEMGMRKVPILQDTLWTEGVNTSKVLRTMPGWWHLHYLLMLPLLPWPTQAPSPLKCLLFSTVLHLFWTKRASQGHRGPPATRLEALFLTLFSSYVNSVIL